MYHSYQNSTPQTKICCVILPQNSITTKRRTLITTIVGRRGFDKVKQLTRALVVPRGEGDGAWRWLINDHQLWTVFK